jgi:hypothetical protein
MFSARRFRPLAVIGTLGVVLLLAACGGPDTLPAASEPATTSRGVADSAAGLAPKFSAPADVSNPMFPLRPGTQFKYRGKIVEGDTSEPHTVVFTVTDLTKMVNGVRTVVAWDRDFLRGDLQEQELAFFAQDDKGNVWNFGEYPEEYKDGKFTGAPSTWIRGTSGAYGGRHMLAQPSVGAQYVSGRIPAIDFHDVARINRVGQATCVPSGCYRQVLVVNEWSPGDRTGGVQVKYYSPGVGLVRVGAQGGDSQEFLGLEEVRRLGRSELAEVRSAALTLDRRAYRISKVYRVTKPAACCQR